MDSSPSGPGLSRRMLLVAGGMVLLGGCGAVPASKAARGASRSAGKGHPVSADAVALRQPAPVAGRGQPTAPHEGSSPGNVSVLARNEQPLYYVQGGHRAIALTIDDGPSPVYTPQILKLLHKYRITASFSMIGVNVIANPGVAREVAEAGHLIVNHTWTHPDLARMPAAQVADQLNRATGAIHKATGRTPDMFRAPFGAWSPAVMAQCLETGMTPLDWSVDPRDWARPGVPEITRNIMANTRSGSIILEHDGGGDRSQTVAALKIVLPRLLAAGYHFTTP